MAKFKQKLHLFSRNNEKMTSVLGFLLATSWIKGALKHLLVPPEISTIRHPWRKRIFNNYNVSFVVTNNTRGVPSITLYTESRESNTAKVKESESRTNKIANEWLLRRIFSTVVVNRQRRLHIHSDRRKEA